MASSSSPNLLVVLLCAAAFPLWAEGGKFKLVLLSPSKNDNSVLRVKVHAEMDKGKARRPVFVSFSQVCPVHMYIDDQWRIRALEKQSLFTFLAKQRIFNPNKVPNLELNMLSVNSHNFDGISIHYVTNTVADGNSLILGVDDDHNVSCDELFKVHEHNAGGERDRYFYVFAKTASLSGVIGHRKRNGNVSVASASDSNQLGRLLSFASSVELAIYEAVYADACKDKAQPIVVNTVAGNGSLQ